MPTKNAVLDFIKSAADTSQPEKGALRYEQGRRYTLPVGDDFTRQCIKDGVAVATEADDPKDLAALRALEPRSSAALASATSSPEAVGAAPAPAKSESISPPVTPAADAAKS